jgi:hypothetical protein
MCTCLCEHTLCVCVYVSVYVGGQVEEEPSSRALGAFCWRLSLLPPQACIPSPPLETRGATRQQTPGEERPWCEPGASHSPCAESLVPAWHCWEVVRPSGTCLSLPVMSQKAPSA